MLSSSEKRCVHRVLEDRVSSGRYSTVAEAAQDVLDAAPLGDYAPDGREHVWILDEWVAEARQLGRDPLARCPDDLLASMNDAHLAAHLQELARGRGSSHAWGIPRRNPGEDTVAELRARLMPPPAGGRD